jgi:cation diffusion facilitator family transporter
MIVGLLLLATATYVALHSILSFGLKHAAPSTWWPFWIAVGSIVLKEFLFWATRAVGRRHRNTALLANAWHHRTDSFSSIAAALGIGATLVLGPRWAFLDHLTAVILAAFLVVVGIRIVRDALRELSDQAPAIEDLPQVAGIVVHIEPAGP